MIRASLGATGRAHPMSALKDGRGPPSGKPDGQDAGTRTDAMCRGPSHPLA